MHSSVGSRNSMIIIGGRNESGILRDSWSFDLFGADIEGQAAGYPILGLDGVTTVASASWRRRNDIELSLGRCAHSAVLIMGKLYVLGGFREDGIIADNMTAFDAHAEEMVGMDTKSTKTSSNKQGSEIKLETMTGTVSLGGRFSMAACLAPTWLMGNSLAHVAATPTPRTIFSTSMGTANHEILSDCYKRGIVVFGGVTAERDYNDIWLLIES